jgi:hypothetical protein
MLCKPLCHWCYNAAFTAAVMTCPLACAAAPMAGTSSSNVISELLHTTAPLSTRELGAVRGGFDMTPKLTINFAFQQIESSGTRIIQSIEVPMTTLNLNMPNITPVVTTNVTAGTSGVTGNGWSNTSNTPNETSNTTPGSNTTTSTYTPAPSYTPTPSNTPTPSYTPAPNNTPSNSSNITLTSSANDGATIVQSALGGGGITNVISNTANNALITQMTTMNIAISGMASWISQQRSSFITGGGAFGSLGLYR